MSTRFALILAVLLAGALLADQMLNDGAASLSLARKLFELVEYLSFWR